MERTQGSPRVDTGPDRRVGTRTARGWVMALALLGLGALATAAEDTDGHGGWRHGSAMPKLVQRQCPECLANSPAGSNARMRFDSAGGMDVAGTVDAEHRRLEIVRISATNAMFALRAEHYARVCKPHRHLCDLIAEHAGMQIVRVRTKRPRATDLALGE